MADVNKSIEISYRADLKQLLNELKKMPGMTEEEAKKMVSQLNRQLKQAEKASQKTGQATARGMKQVKQATQQATVSMRTFRQSARSADRVFGELSTGLELISPELGALAGFASQASSGIEALGRAIGSMNPIFLAITVAAAAAGLAYQLFAVDAEAVEEQAKKTSQRLKELSDATAGIISAANRSATELAVLKGEISELDASIVEAEFNIRTESEKGLVAQRERIQLLQEGLDLIDRRTRATEALSEEETNQLLALEKSIPVLKGIGDLDAAALEGVQIRMKAQERLNAEIQASKDVLSDLEKSVDVQVEQQIELLEYKEEQKRADEELRAAEKQRAAASRQAAANERAAIAEAKKLEAQRIGARNALEMEQRSITLKQLDDAEKVLFTYDERIAKIKDATSSLMEQSETEAVVNQLRIERDMEYFDTIEKMRQEAHDKELDRAKEIEQSILRQRDMNMAAVQSIVSSASASITAIGQIMEEQGNMTKEQMLRLFRANQAAAISEIAVNTAVAVTRAYRDLGPIGGTLAVGALIASGATQTAAVAMQKPPSFHMGGVVPPANAPDERNIKVLSGEAVLDRSTVDRLGGQSGVNALQNGQGMKPTVIVMNPFKHLDRYNRSALKRNSALSGAFRKTRVYGAGGY